MTISELLKILKENGIILAEHGKKHDKYYSPITGNTFPISRDKKQDVGQDLLNKIKKQAGLK
jgi:predicted RNA binding protein YcfA (HicA-like mRNA interferase family)